MRPYGESFLGIVIYVYDFIGLFMFALVPLYLENSIQKHHQNIGRTQIIILIVTVIIAWLMIIIVNIHTILLYIQNKRKAKNDTLEEKIMIHDDVNKDSIIDSQNRPTEEVKEIITRGQEKLDISNIMKDAELDIISENVEEEKIDSLEEIAEMDGVNSNIINLLRRLRSKKDNNTKKKKKNMRRTKTQKSIEIFDGYSD